MLSAHLIARLLPEMKNLMYIRSLIHQCDNEGFIHNSLVPLRHYLASPGGPLKYSLEGTTRCPNKFGIRSETFANEANCVYEKYVFCSKKLLFEHFFESCKMKERIFSNLLNKSLHEKIGSMTLFQFCSSQKMLKKHLFGAQYIFS